MKKTIDAIETLFKQPMDLQTLAGLPKALSAQIKTLLGNMPGIRDCANDASTLVDHAQALFDDITSDIAEATFDKAATLVDSGTNNGTTNHSHSEPACCRDHYEDLVM